MNLGATPWLPSRVALISGRYLSPDSRRPARPLCVVSRGYQALVYASTLRRRIPVPVAGSLRC